MNDPTMCFGCYVDLLTRKRVACIYHITIVHAHTHKHTISFFFTDTQIVGVTVHQYTIKKKKQIHKYDV
jgi:hypothetical protein